jgi:hypothetical protein
MPWPDFIARISSSNFARSSGSGGAHLPCTDVWFCTQPIWRECLQVGMACRRYRYPSSRSCRQCIQHLAFIFHGQYVFQLASSDGTHPSNVPRGARDPRGHVCARNENGAKPLGLGILHHLVGNHCAGTFPRSSRKVQIAHAKRRVVAMAAHLKQVSAESASSARRS